MTFTTSPPLAAAHTLAAGVVQPRPLIVLGLRRRAVLVIGDILAAGGVVLCVPLAILAIGMPIALFVRLLLWIAAMLG